MSMVTPKADDDQDDTRDRFSVNPESIAADHDRFYDVLISRNRGLISESEQRTLRGATILIAGCGGIGGAAIEPLVRAGAESTSKQMLFGRRSDCINSQSSI
jgi:molybdopterin/thiamine biosynthesis adenylyltransferase